jgi:nucleoside-diphosphate-sugar epimerase
MLHQGQDPARGNHDGRVLSELILITGGAGFIGSHPANELLARNCRVRVLDSLVEQVHESGSRPACLDRNVELAVGDVRDAGTVRAALRGLDAVIHLAARVGVGQSMYELADESLGYEPQVDVADGMAELADWLDGPVADDRVDHATAEFASRGLTR